MANSSESPKKCVNEGYLNYFQNIKYVFYALKNIAPCREELDHGYGTGWSTRYYYDQYEKKCKKFTYGGSGGNLNNFVSKIACEKECLVFKDAVCITMPSQGPCKEYEMKYAFDVRTYNCRLFLFGGCLPSSNTFSTLQKCKEMCE
ncbi:unnamed protein product [Larinioides sclopetarius]|uniref:BPTI/Kunitz inhibitor domain-containing protein n=1 Tax=Larinioides sclopetarius TaxID=280406 RepID=A0AAV2B3W1_9ARAC